jgi:hypothetical protein
MNTNIKDYFMAIPIIAAGIFLLWTFITLAGFNLLTVLVILGIVAAWIWLVFAVVYFCERLDKYDTKN